VNKWVRKSIERANCPGYLDELSEIYPADLLPKRPLDPESKSQIRTLHKRGMGGELVRLLLGLTKRKHPFPIEHPYASLFRQKPFLLDQNPKVLGDLEKAVLSLTADEVISGCERPVDINRAMGQSFHKWIRRRFGRKVPFLAEEEFHACRKRAFLDGNDEKILQYVRNEYGLVLTRGRDFLFKCQAKAVVGEARFLSTSGGSQARDLGESIDFIKRARAPVQAVAVLDGIVWYSAAYLKRLKELRADNAALTALLLGEYLAAV